MQGCRESLGGLTAILESDDRLAANALHLAPTDAIVLMLFDSLKVGCNHLKLQARASQVQNEDIHDATP
jgi:hypothetical protein